MADKVSKSAAAATRHKAKASEEKSTAAKFKWNDEMLNLSYHEKLGFPSGFRISFMYIFIDVKLILGLICFLYLMYYYNEYGTKILSS